MIEPIHVISESARSSDDSGVVYRKMGSDQLQPSSVIEPDRTLRHGHQITQLHVAPGLIVMTTENLSSSLRARYLSPKMLSVPRRMAVAQPRVVP